MLPDGQEGLTVTNGGATLWTAIGTAAEKAVNDATQAIVVGAASAAAEQVRENSGQSKLSFYGGLVLEWLKTHVVVFILIIVLLAVLLFWIFRSIYRAFRGRKRNKKRF